MNLKVTNTTCNENFMYPLIYRLEYALSHFEHFFLLSYFSSDILIKFACRTVGLFEFDKKY